jgi:DNA-binding NtrC family response regulator
MGTVNRILVVDDEASVCSSVEKILSRQGHQVVIAQSAEEALQKIEQGKFNLVLADLMMPQVSGIELLKRIRSRWQDLNVIMITGYASISTAVESTRLGAIDYLPKPFTPEELTKVTDRALSNPKPQKMSGPIDVDMPFNEQEVLTQTSEKYVESLTRSDIPEHVSKTYCSKGQRDCKRFELKGQCEGDCPIIVREQKLAAEGKLPKTKVSLSLSEKVKHPVDIDMPFDELELSEATSPEYVEYLSSSDIPIIGRSRFREPGLTQRVLVVDDEAVVCNSIRKILATKGLLVDQAFNAIEALRKISVNQYTMVILDYRMPKIDGIQLLQMIKMKYPDIVTVMITGYASIETAVQATRFGAFDYLPKPFTPDELISVTSRGLELKAVSA